MSSIEPELPEENFISEDELKGLLERWIAPQPSKTLDQRIANSYHTEMGSADPAAISARFPQSQNEVVKMKFCSTCQEEFADKFSFCPVDGSPLSVPASEAQPAVPEPTTTSQLFEAGDPVPSAPEVSEVAGSTALVARGEYHLTMIDDETLVGRLAKEVGYVAHEYQLTWPEFKRDPFGFTKRSLVGYGQMASKAIGNRNVIAGLLVALVAMAVLVGILSLLDRAQPGGISKAGFITFAAIAGLILAAVFATWVTKSQNGAVLGAPDAESNNAVAGMVVAFSFFLLLVGGGVFYNFWQKRLQLQQQQQPNQEMVQFLDIPTEQPTPDEGTAGFDKGKGGGSKPKQEKPGGGGGGGRQEAKPASFGKTPQASLTVPQILPPDPHPPVVKNPSLPTPATLNVDPTLMPPDDRQLNYGLRDSKNLDPSSGPGTGNGMGSGTGTGMGPGSGNGYGPGRDGNIGGGDYHEGGGGPGGGGGGTDYNKVFSSKEVSSKARVISKPEPQYTEEARKNQVTGTVVLRAVFTSGGQVTGIHAVQGLPNGLTERAIAAARQIKFVPATKDGHQVSMYIQLEYNFNLY
ncbi:MAG TPA: energy transducer TonB [Pyrinomonadaceae bacterium]|nr:energy transducer TonB [Pyrinomonadaceae bacterium]